MTTCTRCQGLMLEEHMIDLEGSYGELWSFSWRCFNCGHRDDAVLQPHRQLYAKPVAVRPETLEVQEAFMVPWVPEKIDSLAA